MHSSAALQLVNSSPDRDLAAAEIAATTFLRALGISLDSEGLRGTPGRMARGYAELFTARTFDLTTFPNEEGYDELVISCNLPIRSVCEHLVRAGQLLGWGVPATGVLVETLLDRGADGDVAEAEAAITRLAEAPADEDLVIREIWLLRLRALLAGAHGDHVAYAHFRDRYRDMATTLGFEGHIAWAEAMP